jgi:hypothetical protein
MDLITPNFSIYNNRDYGPYFGADLLLNYKSVKLSSSSFPEDFNFTAKPYK